MSSGSLQSLQQQLAPAGPPSRIQEHRSQGSNRAASFRASHHTAGSSTSLNCSNNSSQARVLLEVTSAQSTDARSANSTHNIEQEALPSVVQAARPQVPQAPCVPGQARRALEAMLINPLPRCHSLSNISTTSSASAVVSSGHSGGSADSLTTHVQPSRAASFLPFSPCTQGQAPAGHINEPSRTIKHDVAVASHTPAPQHAAAELTMVEAPIRVQAPHDPAPAQAATPEPSSQSRLAAEVSRMLPPDQRRHIDDWLSRAQAVEHRHGPDGPQQNFADLMNMLPRPGDPRARDPAVLAAALRPAPYRPFADAAGRPAELAQRRLAENQLPGGIAQPTPHGPGNHAGHELGARGPIAVRPLPAQSGMNEAELLAFLRTPNVAQAHVAADVERQHGPAGGPAQGVGQQLAGPLNPFARVCPGPQPGPREVPARNRANADEQVPRDHIAVQRLGDDALRHHPWHCVQQQSQNPPRAMPRQAPRPQDALVRPAIPANLPEGASDEELLAGMQSQAVIVSRQRARGAYQQVCEHLRAANDQRLNQLAERQGQRQARDVRNAQVPPGDRNRARRNEGAQAPQAHAQLPQAEPSGTHHPAGPPSGNDRGARNHEPARAVPAAQGPVFEESDNPWARAAWHALQHERPLLDATVLAPGRAPAGGTPPNVARQPPGRGPSPAAPVQIPARVATVHRQPGNRAPVRIALPDYAAAERARAKAREESWVRLEKAAAERRQAAARQRDLHAQYPAFAQLQDMCSLKARSKATDAPCQRDDFFNQDACGICMEGAPVVGYLPCRHVVACLACQRAMGVHRPCPVCRSRIKSFKLVPAAADAGAAADPNVQPAA